MYEFVTNLENRTNKRIGKPLKKKTVNQTKSLHVSITFTKNNAMI